MDAARLRLRSVTFKATGQRLEVLRRKHGSATYGDLRRGFAGLLECVDPMGVAGFAAVVWQRDGAYWTTLRVTDGSSVPGGLVPSFVKDVLMRRLGEDDTLDILRGPSPSA
ncbi:MAG TPA: hypothetical protein VF957_23445 [Bradyrhizobium sp.]